MAMLLLLILLQISSLPSPSWSLERAMLVDEKKVVGGDTHGGLTYRTAKIQSVPRLVAD